MKKRKKKIIIILSITILLVILIAAVYIHQTGWLYDYVPSKASVGFIDGGEDEEDSRDRIDMGEFIHIYDGIDLKYSINASIIEGGMSVVIYDVGEDWFNAEGIPKEPSEMEIVKEIDIYESGEYIIDFSEFPNGKYEMTTFPKGKATYRVEGHTIKKIYRLYYLYDEIAKRIWFMEEKHS